MLGFREKQNFPAGTARWISVVSPDDPDGVQLALEPNGNPAGCGNLIQIYQLSPKTT